MNNYAECKKKLDEIRNSYGCKGDVLFRTGLQYVFECGQGSFKNDDWFQNAIDEVNKRHNIAESEGKNLFITRDFEIAILECAKEIAQINTYNILMYIQKEIWLGGDGMDYQRVVRLLKSCMDWIEEDNVDTLDTMKYLGFSDEELNELGYGYLLDYEEEE